MSRPRTNTSRILRATIATLGLAGTFALASPTDALADTRTLYNIIVEASANNHTSTNHFRSDGPTHSFTGEEFTEIFDVSFASTEIAQMVAHEGVLGPHPSQSDVTEQVPPFDITTAGYPPVTTQCRISYRSFLIASVDVTDDGNGTGTVDGNLGKLGLPFEGTTRVDDLYQTVKLSATPSPGYEFDRWVDVTGEIQLDDAQATNPDATLTLGRTMVSSSNPLSGSVKATFKRLPTCPITVTGDGNGTASADAEEGYKGQHVSLTATPNDGYEFDSWEVVSPDGLDIVDDAFDMPEAAVEIRARFKAIPQNEAEEKPTTEEQHQDLVQTGDEVVAAALGVGVVAGVAVLVVRKMRA